MVDENVSVITQSMVISGSVECQGRVVLEGVLEGSFVGQMLDIRETGKISGDIRAVSIQCSGLMEGNVVTESLSLCRTGRHVGTVETRKLAVEPGAILDCALQAGVTKEPVLAAETVENVAKPAVELESVLTAFQEGVRPCCMDVPWSERLELFSQLLGLLEKDKSLIKVMGEAGSGKSVLVDKMTETLPDSYLVFEVGDQTGSVAAILQELAARLAIEGSVDDTQSDLLVKIKSVADERRRLGQRLLLLVDDVEKMFPATLEGIIRSLTSAYGEGGGEGILQLILLGTKEMDAKMVATTIDYFEDETNCQLSLEPLNIKDTADYIRFCLQLASPAGGRYSTALFPYESIRKIHALSHGNIAAINRIADRALRAAHVDGASEVSAKYI